MTIVQPRVFLVQDNEDANNLLAGVLWLKGVEAYKFTSAEDSISKMKEIEGKVDVILMSGNIAHDRGSMLIVNIKRINPNSKILVLADEDSQKTRILDYGADEFTLKPLSPENVADKVFMLISREAVVNNR